MKTFYGNQGPLADRFLLRRNIYRKIDLKLLFFRSVDAVQQADYAAFHIWCGPFIANAKKRSCRWFTSRFDGGPS